ncbi:Lar family restriction alleviation protein [Gordonibacter sp.]|uniref:Lar family restriction alleviation protein n=1 Tax=Gordonibacter sp. TaxID=1968902 RepID=UPI003FA576AF
MTDRTLKPCPFCGHEAAIQPSGDPCEYGRIICSGCHVSTLRYPTIRQMEDAWNMRVETDCAIEDPASTGYEGAWSHE